MMSNTNDDDDPSATTTTTTRMVCPSCDSPFLRFTSTPGSPDDRGDGFSFLFKLTTTTQDMSADTWVVRGKPDNGAVLVQLWQQKSTTKDEVLVETHEVSVGDVVKPELIIWMKNCPLQIVTDPCLKSASSLCGGPWSVTRLSDVIARVIRSFSIKDKSDAKSLYPQCCKHGVLLDGKILLTLVTDATDIMRVPPSFRKGSWTSMHHSLSGMYNIVDVTYDTIEVARLKAVTPVKEEYFEVAAKEEAISVEDFYKMNEWTTWNCKISKGHLKRRKWGHMIFLSHKWAAQGVPGTSEDLQKMKYAVQRYISKKLNQGASDTVKNVSTEDDFGVWVDYPIVPNDPSHKDCETCKQVRRIYLAKMAALPSISTTIALHPNDERRGWILHELTMNSVGNIEDAEGHLVASKHQLAFASRINLMAENGVAFTNGSDGWALRCHEFIRLGQMPRCWPSVTRVLLQEWADNGITSERTTLAVDILFKYARSFHHKCQGLKRAMAVLPQVLARQASPKFENGEWVRVTPVVTLVAMMTFFAFLYFHYAFGSFTALWGIIPLSLAVTFGLIVHAVAFDGNSKLVFNFETILTEIRKQRDDMQALHLGELLCEATERLQQLQFVSMTMGLRAELLYGCGLLHWVTLSSITEALATAKRTVRLIEGETKVCLSTCTVSMTESPSSYELYDVPRESWNIIHNGVPEARLRYALSKLFPNKPCTDDEGQNP